VEPEQGPGAELLLRGLGVEEAESCPALWCPKEKEKENLPLFMNFVSSKNHRYFWHVAIEADRAC